ncbi:DUF3784 domain-containing protein [Natronorubrum daqingense]|uniref:DUF3784 domain-containing protein n=1 Tax=Natronorubrum daqingense TaxID=588898 RepID=A0A1N7AIV8_9EURY|nr:DUF3784 domain-containing protein [Natronorubrum daqingense]APX97963.1 DUF3784 domain-containing protein [Natronorubrum daqingense]SIR39080.1 protein of unknown function [Natronorubrum daqingense]
MSTVEAGSVLLVALVLAVLGVLIRYVGMVSLIGGYDPDTVSDEAGLATFIGTNTLYVAGLTALVAIAEYTQPTGYRAIWLVHLVGVGVLTIRMIRGARRFEAPG